MGAFITILLLIVGYEQKTQTLEVSDVKTVL